MASHIEDDSEAIREEAIKESNINKALDKTLGKRSSFKLASYVCMPTSV